MKTLSQKLIQKKTVYAHLKLKVCSYVDKNGK